MNEAEQRDFFRKSFNVSHETMINFDKYLKILVNYQEKFNLIGKGTLKKIWIRHFCDSAMLLKPILNDLKSLKKTTVLDIGSGAGFPGLVLAILLMEKKRRFKVSLVDSNLKKINFLRELVLTLNLNVEIIHSRVEKVLGRKFDVITSRAVTSLDKLMQISKPFCQSKSMMFFLKGKTWENEVKIIKKKWKFGKIVVKNNLDVENSGGVILIIKSPIHKKSA